MVSTACTGHQDPTWQDPRLGNRSVRATLYGYDNVLSSRQRLGNEPTCYSKGGDLTMSRRAQRLDDNSNNDDHMLFKRRRLHSGAI